MENGLKCEDKYNGIYCGRESDKPCEYEDYVTDSIEGPSFLCSLALKKTLENQV